jgi:alpha-amylase
MAKHSAAMCSLLVLVLLCLGSQLAQSQVLFQGFNWESWKKQGGWYNWEFVVPIAFSAVRLLGGSE